VNARQALASAYCGTGQIAAKTRRCRNRNRVASQQPQPGATLPQDGAVNLVVCRRR
jgi:hypothetical protein